MPLSPILPLYERADIEFTHGQGVYLFDNKGKKYLDFASGYAANSLGHCHPDLVDALTKQANKFWHLSNRYRIPGMLEYCQKIVDNSFADTLFIANSGAEAVECMIKMARRYFNAKGQKNKYRLITLEGAFHGRTLACATAGSAEKIKGFEPAVDGFDRVPFHDMDAIKAAIGPSTAGILIEPIQGEGGMRDHSDEFMKELRKVCDKAGILLLVDEIQCGMGRTGWLFAHEMYGIKPDLCALGKGIGGGFPVSACLATAKVGKAMQSGTHGSTFGGNPLAIAVADTVWDIIAEKEFLDNVRKISNYLHGKLEKFAANNTKYIESITGRGLMLGIKFRKEYDVSFITHLSMNELLLSIPASNNVLRLTPPLIITEKHCDEAMKKLEIVIEKLGKPTSKIKYQVKEGYRAFKRVIGVEKE